jgi:hypothetical protein
MMLAQCMNKAGLWPGIHSVKGWTGFGTKKVRPAPQTGSPLCCFLGHALFSAGLAPSTHRCTELMRGSLSLAEKEVVLGVRSMTTRAGDVKACDRSLCWIMPASCFEHPLLSKFRLALLVNTV